MGAATCWKKALCAAKALAKPLAGCGAAGLGAAACGFNAWASEGRIGVVMTLILSRIRFLFG